MSTREEKDLLISIIESQDIVERIFFIESLISLRFKRRHSLTFVERLFFKRWVQSLRDWKDLLKSSQNAC